MKLTSSDYTLDLSFCLDTELVNKLVYVFYKFEAYDYNYDEAVDDQHIISTAYVAHRASARAH